MRRLAQSKAEKVAQQCPNDLVLGADTTVVVGDEILGHRRRGNCSLDVEAVERKMASGVNGRGPGTEQRCACQSSGTRCTRVRFAELSAAEIDWYVSTEEPLDKAGAYAIQGRAAPFIEEIHGDYFNIVGLPMRLVYESIKKHFADG